MENTNPKRSNKMLLLIILFVLIIGILIGCLWGKTYCPKCPTPRQDTAKQIQVLVWKAPTTNSERFQEIVDSLKGDYSNLEVKYCEKCNDELVMYSFPAVDQGLVPVGQLTSGSSGGTIEPSGGGEAEAYWSINFSIQIKDPGYIYDSIQGDKAPDQIFIGQSDISELSNPAIYTSSDPVVVAVFDTGIDSAQLAKRNSIYQNSATSCLGPNAASGWNFADQNNETEDDYQSPKGHGSNVSALIYEQAQAIRQTPVKILPVKFIKSNGEAHLYDVLCGFAYAQKSGANIINASFGYYAKKVDTGVDSAALLFKEYIRHYLTNNNIILVAAAGNKDDVLQEEACDLIDRNLDVMNFYPASFAGDESLTNVIAVTTVAGNGSGAVSPNQNYSKSVIDIGVKADIINGESFGFRNPRAKGRFIEGSSYATPIVTGLIAGYYRQLQSATTANPLYKFNILTWLSNGPINKIAVEPALESKVRGGKFIVNLAPLTP